MEGAFSLRSSSLGELVLNRSFRLLGAADDVSAAPIVSLEFHGWKHRNEYTSCGPTMADRRLKRKQPASALTGQCLWGAVSMLRGYPTSLVQALSGPRYSASARRV